MVLDLHFSQKNQTPYFPLLDYVFLFLFTVLWLLKMIILPSGYGETYRGLAEPNQIEFFYSFFCNVNSFAAHGYVKMSLWIAYITVHIKLYEKHNKTLYVHIWASKNIELNTQLNDENFYTPRQLVSSFIPLINQQTGRYMVLRILRNFKVLRSNWHLFFVVVYKLWIIEK